MNRSRACPSNTGCRFGEKLQEATVTTGEDGTAAIEWPRRRRSIVLGFTATMPKLVPIHILWDDERHPAGIAGGEGAAVRAGHHDRRHRAGRGRPSGRRRHGRSPRAGDRVRRDEIISSRWVRPRRTPRAGGAWTSRRRTWPGSGAGRTIRTIGAATCVASRKLDSVVVLKKGLTVTGRVVDAAGRPVKGARAIIGHDTWGTDPPTATTNEQGRVHPGELRPRPDRSSRSRPRASHRRFRTSGSRSGPQPSNSD